MRLFYLGFNVLEAEYTEIVYSVLFAHLPSQHSFVVYLLFQPEH